MFRIDYRLNEWKLVYEEYDNEWKWDELITKQVFEIWYFSVSHILKSFLKIADVIKAFTSCIRRKFPIIRKMSNEFNRNDFIHHLS